MKINEAISKKLLKICKEKDLSVNKLAKLSGLTQSTVQSIVNCESSNPKLLTLVRICDGVNISMSEVFKDEIFLNIDDDKLNY